MYVTVFLSSQFNYTIITYLKSGAILAPLFQFFIPTKSCRNNYKILLTFRVDFYI